MKKIKILVLAVISIFSFLTFFPNSVFCGGTKDWEYELTGQKISGKKTMTNGGNHYIGILGVTIKDGANLDISNYSKALEGGRIEGGIINIHDNNHTSTYPKGSAIGPGKNGTNNGMIIDGAAQITITGHTVNGAFSINRSTIKNFNKLELSGNYSGMDGSILNANNTMKITGMGGRGEGKGTAVKNSKIQSNLIIKDQNNGIHYQKKDDTHSSLYGSNYKIEKGTIEISNVNNGIIATNYDNNLYNGIQGGNITISNADIGIRYIEITKAPTINIYGSRIGIEASKINGSASSVIYSSNNSTGISNSTIGGSGKVNVKNNVVGINGGTINLSASNLTISENTVGIDGTILNRAVKVAGKGKVSVSTGIQNTNISNGATVYNAGTGIYLNGKKIDGSNKTVTVYNNSIGISGGSITNGTVKTYNSTTGNTTGIKGTTISGGSIYAYYNTGIGIQNSSLSGGAVNVKNNATGIKGGTINLESSKLTVSGNTVGIDGATLNKAVKVEGKGKVSVSTGIQNTNISNGATVYNAGTGIYLNGKKIDGSGKTVTVYNNSIGIYDGSITNGTVKTYNSSKTGNATGIKGTTISGGSIYAYYNTDVGIQNSVITAGEKIYASYNNVGIQDTNISGASITIKNNDTIGIYAAHSNITIDKSTISISGSGQSGIAANFYDVKEGKYTEHHKITITNSDLNVSGNGVVKGSSWTGIAFSSVTYESKITNSKIVVNNNTGHGIDYAYSISKSTITANKNGWAGLSDSNISNSKVTASENGVGIIAKNKKVKIEKSTIDINSSKQFGILGEVTDDQKAIAGITISSSNVTITKSGWSGISRKDNFTNSSFQIEYSTVTVNNSGAVGINGYDISYSSITTKGNVTHGINNSNIIYSAVTSSGTKKGKDSGDGMNGSTINKSTVIVKWNKTNGVDNSKIESSTITANNNDNGIANSTINNSKITASNNTSQAGIIKSLIKGNSTITTSGNAEDGIREGTIEGGTITVDSNIKRGIYKSTINATSSVVDVKNQITNNTKIQGKGIVNSYLDKAQKITVTNNIYGITGSTIEKGIKSLVVSSNTTGIKSSLIEGGTISISSSTTGILGSTIDGGSISIKGESSGISRSNITGGTTNITGDGVGIRASQITAGTIKINNLRSSMKLRDKKDGTGKEAYGGSWGIGIYSYEGSKTNAFNSVVTIGGSANIEISSAAYLGIECYDSSSDTHTAKMTISGGTVKVHHTGAFKDDTAYQYYVEQEGKKLSGIKGGTINGKAYVESYSNYGYGIRDAIIGGGTIKAHDNEAAGITYTNIEKGTVTVTGNYTGIQEGTIGSGVESLTISGNTIGINGYAYVKDIQINRQVEVKGTGKTKNSIGIMNSNISKGAIVHDAGIGILLSSTTASGKTKVDRSITGGTSEIYDNKIGVFGGSITGGTVDVYNNSQFGIQSTKITGGSIAVTNNEINGLKEVLIDGNANIYVTEHSSTSYYAVTLSTITSFKNLKIENNYNGINLSILNTSVTVTGTGKGKGTGINRSNITEGATVSRQNVGIDLKSGNNTISGGTTKVYNNTTGIYGGSITNGSVYTYASGGTVGNTTGISGTAISGSETKVEANYNATGITGATILNGDIKANNNTTIGITNSKIEDGTVEVINNNAGISYGTITGGKIEVDKSTNGYGVIHSNILGGILNVSNSYKATGVGLSTISGSAIVRSFNNGDEEGYGYGFFDDIVDGGTLYTYANNGTIGNVYGVCFSSVSAGILYVAHNGGSQATIEKFDFKIDNKTYNFAGDTVYKRGISGGTIYGGTLYISNNAIGVGDMYGVNSGYLPNEQRIAAISEDTAVGTLIQAGTLRVYSNEIYGIDKGTIGQNTSSGKSKIYTYADGGTVGNTGTKAKGINNSQLNSAQEISVKYNYTGIYGGVINVSTKTLTVSSNTIGIDGSILNTYVRVEGRGKSKEEYDDKDKSIGIEHTTITEGAEAYKTNKAISAATISSGKIYTYDTRVSYSSTSRINNKGIDDSKIEGGTIYAAHNTIGIFGNAKGAIEPKDGKTKLLIYAYHNTVGISTAEIAGGTTNVYDNSGDGIRYTEITGGIVVSSNNGTHLTGNEDAWVDSKDKDGINHSTISGGTVTANNNSSQGLFSTDISGDAVIYSYDNDDYGVWGGNIEGGTVYSYNNGDRDSDGNELHGHRSGGIANMKISGSDTVVYSSKNKVGIAGGTITNGTIISFNNEYGIWRYIASSDTSKANAYKFATITGGTINLTNNTKRAIVGATVSGSSMTIKWTKDKGATVGIKEIDKNNFGNKNKIWITGFETGITGIDSEATNKANTSTITAFANYDGIKMVSDSNEKITLQNTLLISSANTNAGLKVTTNMTMKNFTTSKLNIGNNSKIEIINNKIGIEANGTGAKLSFESFTSDISAKTNKIYVANNNVGLQAVNEGAITISSDSNMTFGGNKEVEIQAISNGTVEITRSTVTIKGGVDGKSWTQVSNGIVAKGTGQVNISSSYIYVNNVKSVGIDGASIYDSAVHINNDKKINKNSIGAMNINKTGSTRPLSLVLIGNNIGLQGTSSSNTVVSGGALIAEGNNIGIDGRYGNVKIQGLTLTLIGDDVKKSTGIIGTNVLVEKCYTLTATNNYVGIASATLTGIGKLNAEIKDNEIGLLQAKVEDSSMKILNNSTGTIGGTIEYGDIRVMGNTTGIYSEKETTVTMKGTDILVSSNATGIKLNNGNLEMKGVIATKKARYEYNEEDKYYYYMDENGKEQKVTGIEEGYVVYKNKGDITSSDPAYAYEIDFEELVYNVGSSTKQVTNKDKYKTVENLLDYYIGSLTLSYNGVGIDATKGSTITMLNMSVFSQGNDMLWLSDNSNLTVKASTITLNDAVIMSTGIVVKQGTSEISFTNNSSVEFINEEIGTLINVNEGATGNIKVDNSIIRGSILGAGTKNITLTNYGRIAQAKGSVINTLTTDGTGIIVLNVGNKIVDTVSIGGKKGDIVINQLTDTSKKILLSLEDLSGYGYHFDEQEVLTSTVNVSVGLSEGSVEVKTIELNGYKYSLMGSNKRWGLKNDGKTYTNQLVSNVPSLTNAVVNAGLNSLTRRLGDIRRTPEDKYNGVWARAYGRNDKFTKDIETKMEMSGGEAGYDFRIKKNSDDRYYVGFMAGYQNINKIETKQAGNTVYNGEGSAPSAGVYATWIAENGLFADITVRNFWISLDMNNNGKHYKPYRTQIAVSGEFGKAFNIQTGARSKFVIEPKTEWVYSYAGETGNKELEYGKTTGIKGKLGFMVGLNTKTNNGINWQPYMEAGYSYEFDNKTEVKYYGISTETDLSGGYADIGIGLNVYFGKGISGYSLVSYEKGSDQENLVWNLGVRYGF